MSGPTSKRSSITPLIGLYSSVMQSGKTTVAGYLTERHGFERVRFAGPLKAMIEAMAREAGFSPSQAVRMVDGNLKEAPVAAFGGHSARFLMQTLGTEWGRDLISPTLWVDLALNRARTLMAQGHAVVIDDMRFPNEAQAIRDAGGFLVRVDRFDQDPLNVGHSSEGQLDGWNFEFTVPNHGSRKDLERHVARLVAYSRSHVLGKTAA